MAPRWERSEGGGTPHGRAGPGRPLACRPGCGPSVRGLWHRCALSLLLRSGACHGAGRGARHVRARQRPRTPGGRSSGDVWAGELSRPPGSAPPRSIWHPAAPAPLPAHPGPGPGPGGAELPNAARRGLSSLRQGGALRSPHRRHRGSHTHQTLRGGGDSGSARSVDNTPLTSSWGEPWALLGLRPPGGDNLFLKAHVEKRSRSCANTAGSPVPACTRSPRR